MRVSKGASLLMLRDAMLRIAPQHDRTPVTLRSAQRARLEGRIAPQHDRTPVTLRSARSARLEGRDAMLFGDCDGFGECGICARCAHEEDERRRDHKDDSHEPEDIIIRNHRRLLHHHAA